MRYSNNQTNKIPREINVRNERNNPLMTLKSLEKKITEEVIYETRDCTEINGTVNKRS